jgi:1-acyl-sn-glycerol-3-phosphate acyltransferase
MLVRGMAIIARSKVRSVRGLEHIGPERDPFMFVLNHSSRQEALIVPALLILLRSGRRIHFLADWNFRMIPGVDLLYRRAGAITVPQKPARPRILNVVKPFFTDAVPPMEQARLHLIAGRSIGIFPEGTANPNPSRLLRGRHGAARLSLETGIPVVPGGLRFPAVPSGAAIPEGSPMEIEIGPPLDMPRAAAQTLTPANVRARHAQIMNAISLLCGKSWEFQTRETSDETL